MADIKRYETKILAIPNGTTREVIRRLNGYGDDGWFIAGLVAEERGVDPVAILQREREVERGHLEICGRWRWHRGECR